DVAPVRIVEAARPGALAGLGEGDRGLHFRSVEARVRRGDAPPSRPIGDIGIAAIRSVGHLAHLIEGLTRIGSTRAPAQKSGNVGGDKARTLVGRSPWKRRRGLPRRLVPGQRFS